MTGAGSADVSFVKPDGWLSIPADPTHYLPGRDLTVQTLSLSNTLERLRTPSNAEAVDSLAGILDGSFSATWGMSSDTHEHVRDVIFNDSGTGFTTGQAALSRWYLGVEYLDSGSTSVAERVLKGCIPLEYSIAYQQGTNAIRESATFGFADEDLNTAITPTSLTSPSDGSDVAFHGASLTVDAGTVSKLQSATLSFSNISRYQRANQRSPVDAVPSAIQTTLDAAAIFGGTDYLELAYGSSAATSPDDRVGSVSGSIAFDVGGTTVATYTLPNLTPEGYEWSDLVEAETDLTDPVTYQVTGDVSIST